MTTTETNRVMFGLATSKVRIPGRLEAQGTITNATFTGTNSFGVSGGPYGALLFRRFNITTLADTNNLVDPGGASYIKVSGPSQNFDILGLQSGAGYDGYVVILQNGTQYQMQIRNDNGGTATTNRIYTGTGADIWITNNPASVQLIYDSAVYRWIVLSHSD